jgi:hypothetical protein
MKSAQNVKSFLLSDEDRLPLKSDFPSHLSVAQPLLDRFHCLYMKQWAKSTRRVNILHASDKGLVFIIELSCWPMYTVLRIIKLYDVSEAGSVSVIK